MGQKFQSCALFKPFRERLQGNQAPSCARFSPPLRAPKSLARYLKNDQKSKSKKGRVWAGVYRVWARLYSGRPFNGTGPSTITPRGGLTGTVIS
eukprot:1188585-Prorocentrum_minimum.AAC.2